MGLLLIIFFYMTLKQYLENLPKTEHDILVKIKLESTYVFWPFYFVKKKAPTSLEAYNKYVKEWEAHFPNENGDLVITDGSYWGNVFDINQEIDLSKNSIYATNRSGFREKLTFYIQDLIPIDNSKFDQ